tara:strand:+ start:1169 stop:1597 length:429 start_codon:yes stop_codon:yes gene_type:complete
MRKPNEIENMNKVIHQDWIINCAKNDYGLISCGFIYRVTNGFVAIQKNSIYIKDGIVMRDNFANKDYEAYKEKYIKKDSFIEFRYENDAHCRDEEDDYWRIDKSILALCCEPVAKINEYTRRENKLSLQKILKYKLYIKINE